MKFGFHTVYGLNQSLPESIDAISRSGFKGFEAFNWELTPFFSNKESFLDLLSEKEIQLASIYTYGRYIRFPGSLSGIYRYFLWQWRSIPRIIKFAVDVGCNQLVLGGDQRLKREPREKDIMEMARSLNKIGKTCNDSGIRASYHFFHPGHLIKDRARLERLCELTDPDLVHLAIDNGHLTWGGIDPIDIIQAHRNRIGHVHFKNLKNGDLREFGDNGTSDFPGIVQSLRSIGYAGWIIVDNESVGTTVYESAVKAKNYIDRYLVLK